MNLVFIVCLISGGVTFLVREFYAANERDQRPKGTIFSLNADRKLISATGTTITLPAGTIIQESTPQGAATLGKSHEREYLLLFTSIDQKITTNSPYAKSSDWMPPYTLAQPNYQ